jgi:acyl-coenzyme A thioesterase PaaI-like protein
MNVEAINKIINEKPNLSTALGMEFISTPEDDTCMARMRVDERNRQPFGNDGNSCADDGSGQ